MSTPTINVKQEPVDPGYEEPPQPTENATVKEEPNENESDDDMAWMNDEDLQFLNEIDLASESKETDSQPSIAEQATEPDRSEAAASSNEGSESADATTPKSANKRKRNRRGRSNEAADTPPPVVAPVVTPTEPLSIKTEIDEYVKAIRNQKAMLEVEKARKHIERMNASANASTSNGSANANSASLNKFANTLNELVAKKATESLVDVAATSPCSPASVYNILAANNFQISPPTAEPEPRAKKKRLDPGYTQEALQYEIEKAVENIRRMKEQKQNSTPPAIPLPVPVQIKQEKVTPPREIPAKANEECAPAVDLIRDLRAVKEEPKSPTRQNDSRDMELSPKSRQTYSTVPVNDKSLNDDAAFLAKRRDMVNRDLASTSTSIPAPIRVKTEPVDKWDLPRGSSTSHQSMDKETIGRNPVMVKRMPEPMRIKAEPGSPDEYLREERIMYPSRKIEPERFDDALMPHRQRVTGFIRESVKNINLFENNRKLQRRFFFTPTFIVHTEVEDTNKYRSPLMGTNPIVYDFNTPMQKVDTMKFGVEKLSQNSAKIVSLLGFNVHDLFNKRKLETNDEVAVDVSESVDQEAFYVHAASQTDFPPCSTCTARKLQRFTDREVQTVNTGAKSTSSANTSYDGIPQATLYALSQMTSAQQTAIQEFADLLRGPAPTSTNDVTRMREKLMDIFTLAQSQASKTVSSSADPLNISRRVTPRFDQSEPKNIFSPAAPAQPLVSAYASQGQARPLFPSTQANTQYAHIPQPNNPYPLPTPVPAPVPYPHQVQNYVQLPVQGLPNPYHILHPQASKYTYRAPGLMQVNQYRNPQDPRNINVQVHPRHQ